MVEKLAGVREENVERDAGQMENDETSDDHGQGFLEHEC